MPDWGLVAQVAIQAFIEAATSSGTNNRKQIATQFLIRFIDAILDPRYPQSLLAGIPILSFR